MSATMLVLSGCGHNVVQFTSGKHFDFGVTASGDVPVFGFKYTDGQTVTAAVKEKTLVNVTIDDNIDGKTSTKEGAATSGKVTGILMSTGDQTNGYVVDVVKALAEKDVEAAKKAAVKADVNHIVDAKVVDGKMEVQEIKINQPIVDGKAADAVEGTK